ncbi:hypothetical protein [Belnapia rosea]|uniref:Uncharacterized protein n=1 Tax=Belnapia rosea TaxID=938405 RepID=A0A1G6ZLE0_9PROT|nr:hypothetical protein [Belnapia rosea]SDB67127.1 hypothetical protein SAMN02927895_03015 [Belnapia rosea]SDE03614.1 hypothetical protein SAMN04487779_101714 [Belnapia rosea]
MKTSLFIMLGLTVLFAIGLRWREERVAVLRPAVAPRRKGFLAAQKHRLNRWLTAATLAALTTLLVLGGLHWLRVWQGG